MVITEWTGDELIRSGKSECELNWTDGCPTWPCAHRVKKSTTIPDGQNFLKDEKEELLAPEENFGQSGSPYLHLHTKRERTRPLPPVRTTLCSWRKNLRLYGLWSFIRC